MNKNTMILYAAVDTFSGYGSCARGIAKALIELYKDKFDIKIISCGWGNTPMGFIEDNQTEWSFLNDYILKENLTYQPDIMCWHTIPVEANPIGKYNILFTAGIETDICAPQWIEHINKMDLTIVPSKHSKDVFLNSKFDKQDSNTKQVVGQLVVEKPIEVVFEGFMEDIFQPIKWV